MLDMREMCSDSGAGILIFGYISRHKVLSALFCGSSELKGLDG